MFLYFWIYIESKDAETSTNQRIKMKNLAFSLSLKHKRLADLSFTAYFLSLFFCIPLNNPFLPCARAYSSLSLSPLGAQTGNKPAINIP